MLFSFKCQSFPKFEFSVKKLISFWLLIGSFNLVSCQQQTDAVVICTKNFTEQLILGELLAITIETQTDIKVERRFNLAGELCHQGLVAGEIDVYVEYTGTAFTNILQQTPITDPHQVYQYVQQAYPQKFKAEWLPPLGFNNTFAMVVRGADARRLGLKTISDVAKYTPQWIAGFGYEFVERKDGFPGLAQTYNLKLAGPPKTMDLGLIYRALIEKQVDLVAGNSTDGLIAHLDLVILEDNKQYFPPYEAAPVIRQSVLKRYPELGQALNSLAGRITASDMQKLNYQVDGQQRNPKDVVQEFLQHSSEP